MKPAPWYDLSVVEELDLSTNENPLGPSPRVARALASVDAGRYPDKHCSTAEARIARMLGVAPSQVLLGPGASGVLRMVSETFLMPGDEVVLATPGFCLYPALLQRRCCKPLSVPLTADYRHDLPAMARAISPGTRAVIICNPNNPTGQPVTRQALECFMRQVPKHVLVLIDEAYYEYSSGPQHAEGMDWVRQEANVLVLRSFSKAYGLAGLRAGYAVGPEPLISALRRVRDPYCVNSMAQVAVIAAIEDRAHLAAVRTLNDQVREELYAAVDQLGLEFIPSAANFVTVCCNGDDARMTERLLEHGVRVCPGRQNGMPGWMRVSTGTVDHVRRFASALQTVLRKREWPGLHLAYSI